MADTLGSLIDKLFTVDQKMFMNQEILYEIRRMTFEEFKEKYWNTEDGAERLWQTFKKACDLNVQRNAIIDELDSFIIQLAKDAVLGNNLDKYLQLKHKSY